MWQQKDQYYLQNGSATICTVWLKGELTYELWCDGKQYAGFLTSDEAKIKCEELAK